MSSLKNISLWEADKHPQALLPYRLLENKVGLLAQASFPRGVVGNASQ